MDESFRNLITRLRQGESEAAWQLIELYEPQIRRAVRVRMRDPHLRKVVDSMDICQTVFANFFVRAANGEYELDEPQDLIALLVTMARNRVNDWYRKEKGRDGNRPAMVRYPASELIHDRRTHHTDRAEAADLLAQIRDRLTEDERRVVDSRASGKSWQQIGREQQVSADSARMRFRRSLDRVVQELGLDELIALE